MNISHILILFLTTLRTTPQENLEEPNFVRGEGIKMDDSEYLKLLRPDHQHLESVKSEASRLGFTQKSNKMITKILAKLDNMKFIVNRRLEEMGENVSRKIKEEGINPVYEYHRVYNSLMNPLTNPYLQMSVTNTMMAPPQMTDDKHFKTFQDNLKNFANVYAESVANLKAGLYQNPKQSSFHTNAVNGGF